MDQNAAIAVVGTFDSKGEEHLFIKQAIEGRGLKTLSINVGTKSPSTFPADLDLYGEVIKGENIVDRDEAIEAILTRAREVIEERYEKGEIFGIISAGGGTGTHIGTSIMRVLPLGVPKVMVSTVASRDMAKIVGTKDITMMHSVVDLLGVNSISGGVLDRAAGAVCGMVQNQWKAQSKKKRVALTMFGFITKAAELTKGYLEEMGYEVIAFHANGTGGMAMEELAAEGYFQGILDLATHELADELTGGYCRGIGPERLEPVPRRDIPRLVVPGGLDCAVLEFTRETIPDQFRDRKIFFYDFRSAIRLNEKETRFLAGQLAEKLNKNIHNVKALIPVRGWSEADQEGGPLYDPGMSDSFVQTFRQSLNPRVEIKEADLHINDPAFAKLAATIMDEMLQPE
ncbi:MAG: Tm-1-like ATP-binding domain-containing protein [Deltaproteobacteria bacterium]|nr:Tm-1-like ATP-binding domain-containing protein [Deltaproteobacteria bacterium]MBW2345481.1 Tm-1-like ATP-binding domain-containing protein [Deltaproteobacteria bacterium]